MIDLVFFLLFVAAVTVGFWYLAEKTEQRMIEEMSDVAVQICAIYDDHGKPLNKFASEHSRRTAEKAKKE